MKKNIYFEIHKWVGLVTGLIVFIVSITGSIYVFYDDLKLKIYPDRFLITENQENQTPLPLSRLKESAQLALPAKEKVTRIDLYPAKNRSWVFRVQKTNEQGLGYRNYYEYYKRVYINPYTAEILKVEDAKNEFFFITLQLHRNLLLGDKYGSPIVGIAVILFILLLISGLILWWPKNRKWKTVKKAVWIDTKVKWKRLVYDIHNVSGFYTFSIAIVIAFTGIVFTFADFKKGVGDFFNQFDRTAVEKHAPIGIDTLYQNPLDNILYYTLAQEPSADMLSIRLRGKKAESLDIQVRLSKNRTGNFRWYYFNKSGSEISEIKSGDALPLGDKIVSLNYDLHTGNLLGIPTKILYFIVALICAALPVTGYIMWSNKFKKKAKKKSVPSKKSITQEKERGKINSASAD